MSCEDCVSWQRAIGRVKRVGQTLKPSTLMSDMVYRWNVGFLG